MPPDPPSVACLDAYACIKCTYVTPLLKILGSQSGNDASYSQLRLRSFALIILVTPLTNTMTIAECNLLPFTSSKMNTIGPILIA